MIRSARPEVSNFAARSLDVMVNFASCRRVYFLRTSVTRKGSLRSFVGTAIFCVS